MLRTSAPLHRRPNTTVSSDHVTADFPPDCGMDLTEPFLGSQGWLSGKPTVQERPSHVGPWFTRRPLGRRFLFVSMRFLLVQGDTREVTDRYHAHHLLALSHREMPE